MTGLLLRIQEIVKINLDAQNSERRNSDTNVLLSDLKYAMSLYTLEMKLSYQTEHNMIPLTRSHGEADVNRVQISVVQQLVLQWGKKTKQKLKRVWMSVGTQSTQAFYFWMYWIYHAS